METKIFNFKARWLRDVALATSNQTSARVAREAIEAHRRVSCGQSRGKCAARVRRANIELLKAELLKSAAVILFLFTIGIGQMWGVCTKITERTFSSSDWKTGHTAYTDTWSDLNCNFYRAANYNKAWDYVRLAVKGGSSSSSTSTQTPYIRYTQAISSQVSKVMVIHAGTTDAIGTNLRINWVALSVYNGSTKVDSVTITDASFSKNTVDTIVFTPTSGDTWGSGYKYNFYANIYCKGSSNRGLNVTKLQFDNCASGCTAPEITAQPTGATYTKNDVATALSITATGTSVTYQWYSNTTNTTSGASSIGGATNSTYTPSTSTVGTTYYYCVASSSSCTTTSNIVSVVVNAPTHKAYFYNGSTLLNTGGTSFAEGAAVSYSGSTPSSCDTGTGASTTFVGWATDTWAGKKAAKGNIPSGTTFYDIVGGESLPNMSTGDVTYYAVFAYGSSGGSSTWEETDFADLTSSDVFVLATPGNYALPSNGGDAKPIVSAITVSNGKITSTVTDGLKWNMSGNSTDGYTFYPNGTTSTWLCCTTTNSSGSNDNIRINNTGTRKVWILDSNGDLVTNDTYTDRWLCCYNSADFRGYVASNVTSDIISKCYKYSSGTTYSNYMTTCCTQLGTINGSINLSQTGSSITVSGWTYTKGDAAAESNINTYDVYLYSEDDSYVTPVQTQTCTYNSKSVTFTGLTLNKQYKIKIGATGKSSYCDITPVAVTTINSHDATTVPFKFTYSVYIDDGTNANYAHNYITASTTNKGTVTINKAVLNSSPGYYQFKVAGFYDSFWGGQSGTSEIPNGTEWTCDNNTNNIRLRPNIGGNYIFTIDYASTPKVTVTFPTATQAANNKIWLDNSILNWSTMWYRVGNTSANQVSSSFTLVPGTDKFYVVNTLSQSMEAWQLANNCSWSGSNSIYKVNGNSYEITQGTEFQKYVVESAGVTIVPTTPKASSSDGCDYYAVTKTDGMLTHTATITTPTNGTITIGYTDVNSASQSKTTTTAGLAHRTILTITATPDSHYELASLTVNGSAFTSGETYILDDDATIAATFTLVNYAVTWYAGGTAAGNITTAGDPSTSVEHGSKVTKLPTDPDGSACDKTFVGWTNTTSYVHGTSPLFTDAAGSPTINADASFYAVFAEVNSVSASLTKMTADDDLEVGDKIVIIAQDTRYGMYQASASSYVSYWTTTDMDGEPSLSEIEADAKKYLDVATGGVTDTWKLGDATNGYLYNSSSTYLEFSTTNSSDLTLIKWTDDSFTFQAGQYISCRTDITGANANKWRGAGSSCDPEAGNNCSGMAYYYLYKYVPGGTTATGHTINCADCGSSVTPTYTAAPTGGTVSVTKSATPVASGSTVKTCTAVDLTVTITPASHYTLTGFTATGLTTGTATISPTVNTVVPTASAQTFTVTVSAGATGTLNLTPTFTAQTPLTITLSTNSKGTFTNPDPWPIYSGETFTFPNVTPSDPSCATFVGWIAGTTFEGDGTTHDAPVTIAANTVSDPQNSDATYTAVFYETETTESDAYVKVTAAPEAPATWANDHYLIVYENGNLAFDGSRTDGDGDKIDAASNTVAVSITSSAIAATNALAASEWKIALISGSNYSIQSASGKYIGQGSDANGLTTNTSALNNTLSISSSGDFGVVSAGGAYLRYNANSGQERFRYYKSSSYTNQQAIQLYKLGTAVVETRTYTTNPACTPKYRVTVASVTGGSPTANPKFNPEGETVTLTANPAAGYTFTGWTLTHTEGGAAASVTYTEGSASTETAVFEMPAYDVTVTASYAKKVVSELKVMDGSTVVANTTGSVSGTVNISTGANKTLDVVITPADAFDHSWTASVTAGGTNASISNVTDAGFRVNGLAQGDATVTVTAPNDGSAKVVTFTVHVTDILPEEIILKRDGSDAPIDALTMYYDAANSRGQYVKVNVSFTPTPTNKDFSVSADGTFVTIHAQAHTNPNYYATLNGNKVTTSPVNVTFTSAATSSVTKNLVVTVLPCPADQFVDYIHGNATVTRAAQVSADHWSINTSITTPTLSDKPESSSADCEAGHYHLIGWLPQSIAEALFEAGTPITSATEGLVTAGAEIEASGTTWYAIWAKKE